jgi:hypothetical protein
MDLTYIHNSKNAGTTKDYIMPSTLTLKIDGNDHVVHYTTVEDDVIIRGIQFYNAFTDVSQITKMLKFKLKNAVAEILNGDVKIENVDVKS